MRPVNFSSCNSHTSFVAIWVHETHTHNMLQYPVKHSLCVEVSSILGENLDVYIDNHAVYSVINDVKIYLKTPKFPVTVSIWFTVKFYTSIPFISIGLIVGQISPKGFSFLTQSTNYRNNYYPIFIMTRWHFVASSSVKILVREYDSMSLQF